MTIKNAPFVGAEIGILGWTISHAIVNEWLQTGILVLTFLGLLVGLYKTLRKKP